MEMTVFTMLALVSVVGALLTIIWRDPLWSAFSLVASMVGQAGLYVTLAAGFLAALQVIVFGGAVFGLFVVVVRLLRVPANPAPSRLRVLPYAGGLAVLLLVGKFVKVLLVSQPGLTSTGAAVGTEFGSVTSFGEILLQQFLLPFELVSLILLVAMVGAAAIARSCLGEMS